MHVIVTVPCLGCAVRVSLNNQVKQQKGVINWKELLECDVRLPLHRPYPPLLSTAMKSRSVPCTCGWDSFACCAPVGRGCRICYQRFPTVGLVRDGFSAPAKWYRLKEDRAVNAVKDTDTPGMRGGGRTSALGAVHAGM